MQSTGNGAFSLTAISKFCADLKIKERSVATQATEPGRLDGYIVLLEQEMLSK